MDSKCGKAIFKAIFEEIYKENHWKGKNTYGINLKIRKLLVDFFEFRKDSTHHTMK